MLVASAGNERILFLSGTYPGTAHDKRIADEEHLTYPPGTTLYKDTGFQGYEPPVEKTCQAKKKAAGARANARREAGQPQAGEAARPCGTRHRRDKAKPNSQRGISEQEAGAVRRGHGSCLRTT